MSRSRTANLTLSVLFTLTALTSTRAFAQEPTAHEQRGSEEHAGQASRHATGQRAAAHPRGEGQRPEPEQHDERPRTPVDPVAAAIGGGAAALTLGLGIGIYLAPPTQHSSVGVWRGGMLADEPFRDLIRASSDSGMSLAGHISDALLVGTIGYTTLVDTLLVPLLQGDPDLAWQASIAHALAFGITLSVGGIVKRVAGRARPYERQCEANPNAPGCDSGDTFESFYSLHTGLAATSAGVSCALHLERNLYGDQAADIASCGSSIAAATLTGLLRVVSDRHYLSDVVIGGLLGFAVGYFVPLLMVPSRTQTATRVQEEEHPDERPSDFQWSVVPSGAGGEGFSAGVAIVGTF